ncbi:alpha-galactosidase [Halolactibacillus alkaliphilus]|uniref:Alpha-galactosidase n=1 Tax=Halolactibacillus alkaliphilus TaxID=442899 RepID=A0A511X4R1_9BACI|nr:glycoside hydrolase family 27 protein [Halolactibacillus alkaliphilus]GEN57923.1 alpha-galactosidase [Halolactibacillus alkaliphilus]GGN73485.1 alpha-galactosidase [Halolactibacillus alkaliphilus]SFO97223.1 Alpha galactosidase A [Halolactibacillus alkaliphilus]
MTDTLATTPPMGWNSWDCYGATVTEEEVKGNASYVSEHLKSSGYEYIVVDIQWYEAGALSSVYRSFADLTMDSYGRLTPATNRFPSAKNNQGFKPLADYIHSLGLKFGIHIMRGIPRQAVHQNCPIKGSKLTARDIAKPNSICPWNTDMYGVRSDVEAGQIYYNSLFDLYAAWGVDFVKVDDIADSKLYGMSHMDEIKMIRQAINQSGRDMVLSLSPGPSHLEDAEALIDNANMWRITDDFWDVWPLLKDMFTRCHQWSNYVGPGQWPDADMLPLGHIGIRSVDGGASDRYTRFTHDEQLTLMTLWCIFRSPLMFGGECRDNDAFTLSLLTNKDLLNMHQNGKHQHQLYREDDEVIWYSETSTGDGYIALFNLHDTNYTIQLKTDILPVEIEHNHTFRDVFSGDSYKSKGDQSSLSFNLRPHASICLHFKY